MDSLVTCIKYLYPNALKSRDIRLFDSGNGVIQIRYWNESVLGPQPSIESILSNEEEAEAARQLAICHAQRRAEYPPMAEYLDGIVKGDQAQIQKYIADCLAVKAKYPKP
jgi:hypothetical protein